MVFVHASDEFLSHPRLPAASGVAALHATPQEGGVLQMINLLRGNGWRRIVLFSEDTSPAATRLAIAAKVRLFARTDSDGASSSQPGANATDQPMTSDFEELTQREVEVLQCVADGNTNREVGEILGLSGLTIKSHLARIGRKMGTGDRAEMVAKAMRAGLIR